MKITTYEDLKFRVIITREDGDDWPVLVTGKQSYDITAVEVLVRHEDGQLSADLPMVRAGRRIKADGSFGTSSPGSFTGYHGLFAPNLERRAIIDAQADRLMAAALASARTAFAALAKAGEQS